MQGFRNMGRKNDIGLFEIGNGLRDLDSAKVATRGYVISIGRNVENLAGGIIEREPRDDLMRSQTTVVILTREDLAFACDFDEIFGSLVFGFTNCCIFE